MSMKVEDIDSLFGDDSLNWNSPHLPAVEKVENGTACQLANIIGNDVYFFQSRNYHERALTIESIDEDSIVVPLSADILPCADDLFFADVPQFADILTSTDFLPFADASSSVNFPSLVEFLSSEISSNAVAETNIIIQKEEDLNRYDNVFGAVIESRFDASIDNAEQLKYDRVFAEAEPFCEEREIPKNGFFSNACSTLLSTSVQPSKARFKLEHSSIQFRKPITYHVSSCVKIRDVRVVLVDIFSKNSHESSSNVLVNHVDSKSCVCVLCTGKFRFPKNTGNVVNKEKGKPGSLKVQSGRRCGRLRDGKWYLCGACPARFIFAHGLERHAVMDHGVYLCLVCRIEFQNDSDLRMHLKVHPGKKHYSCVFCNFKSSIEAELEVHRKTHTSRKCFSCAECKVKFKEGYSLLKHVSEHTNKRNLVSKDSVLELKNKRKSQKQSLNTSNLLSCAYCQAKFRFASQLRDHLMKHTDEKSFMCSYCRAKFKRLQTLKNHVIIHTNERPFACTYFG